MSTPAIILICLWAVSSLIAAAGAKDDGGSGLIVNPVGFAVNWVLLYWGGFFS